MLQGKTKSDTVKCPISGHALASTLAGSVSWTLFVQETLAILLSFMLVDYKESGICVKKMGEFGGVGLFPSHPGKEGIWGLLHVCMCSSEEVVQR